MVGIDSRSFGVNEFPGDRETPSDMKEILQCASSYLKEIGFPQVRVNQPEPGQTLPNPLLMAEIPVSPEKPTILFYAHLDKQPYMDDGAFKRWEGVAPTTLRWNEDKTRAYGRGAADDLSGVVCIGLSVDAALRAHQLRPPMDAAWDALPCNIKVIYETEEECGSHSLAAQIEQNRDFFKDIDCVIITDVVNPATGVPGLTASLRGIIQMNVEMTQTNSNSGLDAQTALYKLLARLIREDHSLAVEAIARADAPVTDEEMDGLGRIPTTVEDLRGAAGLIPQAALTVESTIQSILKAQLRTSFVNARPGHRVSGSVIFGRAGARLTFSGPVNSSGFREKLLAFLTARNRYNLEIILNETASEPDRIVFDLQAVAADKDPHSGVTGGPFPIAELQVARWIDAMIQDDGAPSAEFVNAIGDDAKQISLTTQSLNVSLEGSASLFSKPEAKAIVEIRLAPGNESATAQAQLKEFLTTQTLPGFHLKIEEDKGASPWRTGIAHPIFGMMMDSLERGFGQAACLYGCGGSIPFVPKLMDALGDAPPLCLGAYDPESRMHEPNESMSMVDLLGCARSIVYFMHQLKKF
ncbi:MAG: M20/M25/M40 family metallo-hydrolase [Candidatus Nitrohelix vancouverensis]|uniref:M20/M25/M40 family metallo-hydrolase n=1 Tax=Candidatus Nitrohelix vancouverensis TaxID=2705534 RepID=A0A7T0C573_9BACT|nr:MAG: M20/M25/M40 family metallo-hydrolase [Candidatus Nitrohelix vancouverensis]